MGSTSRTGVPLAASHVAVAIVAVSVVSGCAQKMPVSSFADLPDRIRPGHTVYVTDTQGEETRGRLQDVSRSALTVSATEGVMQFSADRVTAIDRHGDSLWNGLAIGLGVGTAMALFADQREVPCPGERAGVCRDAQLGARLGAIAAFGAIGIGVDALVRRRTPVYRAPEQRSSVSRFTHLHLENWRNFRSVDVDLSRRIFLVGPNASGKSNLLDVFRCRRSRSACTSTSRRMGASTTPGPYRSVWPPSTTHAVARPADEHVRLQYRIWLDAVAPSRFVAVTDGGIAPPDLDLPFLCERGDRQEQQHDEQHHGRYHVQSASVDVSFTNRRVPEMTGSAQVSASDTR